MPQRLKTGEKLVGSKQTKKALREGRAKAVFIARDADTFVTDPIRQLAAERGVETVDVSTMRELGEHCAVEVPTACAALL